MAATGPGWCLSASSFSCAALLVRGQGMLWKQARANANFLKLPISQCASKLWLTGLQRQEKELLNQNHADKKESAGWKGALEAWSCIEPWKVRVAANLKHKACLFLLLRDAFFSVAITWTEVGLQLGSRLSPSVAGLGRNRDLAPVLASPSAPSASTRHSTQSE